MDKPRTKRHEDDHVFSGVVDARRRVRQEGGRTSILHYESAKGDAPSVRKVFKPWYEEIFTHWPNVVEVSRKKQPGQITTDELADLLVGYYELPPTPRAGQLNKLHAILSADELEPTGHDEARAIAKRLKIELKGISDPVERKRVAERVKKQAGAEKARLKRQLGTILRLQIRHGLSADFVQMLLRRNDLGFAIAALKHWPKVREEITGVNRFAVSVA